jgi:cell division protein FtsN
MAKRRRGKPAPRKRPRRLGTILFLVGIASVLGGTFLVGAMAGRLSFKPTASLASGRTVERPAKPAPAPPPELTFYRELTAPLTPRPLPPKPTAKPAAKRDAAPAETVAVSATAPTPPPPADAARYTVQVASYNARAQAEALRARLASTGHAAYVAEAEANGVTRYRVRIGAYATAEEAREAAVRVASDARVATFVTTEMGGARRAPQAPRAAGAE